MKFEEALVHLRQGKRVRCKQWPSEYYFGLHENQFEYEISPNDILNCDWELWGEPEKYYQDGIELPTMHNQLTLETRLSELEQWTRAEEDRVNSILKTLETKIFHLTMKSQWAEKALQICEEAQKKPHRCPACNGLSFRTIFDENHKPENISCVPCDGKGFILK